MFYDTLLVIGIFGGAWFLYSYFRKKRRGTLTKLTGAIAGISLIIFTIGFIQYAKDITNDTKTNITQEPATEEKEEISAPITEETEEPEDEKIEDPVEEEPEPKESDNYGNKDYYADASVTYDQLARTPDNFEDNKAVFTGTVLQVMDGEYSYNTIRLAVDDNYDNVIMIDYSKDIMQERLLEDDKITVYGISRGLITYTSTFKQEISIPHMDAYIIERIQ